MEVQPTSLEESARIKSERRSAFSQAVRNAMTDERVTQGGTVAPSGSATPGGVDAAYRWYILTGDDQRGWHADGPYTHDDALSMARTLTHSAVVESSSLHLFSANGAR